MRLKESTCRSERSYPRKGTVNVDPGVSTSVAASVATLTASRYAFRAFPERRGTRRAPAIGMSAGGIPIMAEPP
ncbi:hypothetical protein DSECCO2_485800 [anaerobic digester metagenome]